MGDSSQQLSTGRGPLFRAPDPEGQRATLQSRSKAMVEKTCSVSVAVDKWIQDGDYLASGGFGGDRIATALLHEIVRQKKQRLQFAGHTSTHDFQILVAGNQTGRGQLLSKVDIAYIVGLEARGLSPHARRVVESGEVELCEWTNYTLALRLQAAAMGVPFLPARSLTGTDTFQRSGARVIECPFTGLHMAAIPALVPDVAVIHVHEADVFGNCRIRGTSVSDCELARAAKRVIVSCERLIKTDEVRQDPTSTAIPFYCVDAVCHVPCGSYPGNMPYEYFSDEHHLAEWLNIERDPAQHLEFVTQMIFDCNDFDEYLERSGGHARMEQLRREELHPEQ